LISNRKDTDILIFYYKIVREVVGLTNITPPKVFMSDMADELYTAWELVMGPVEKRLYCTWHVDRCWKKKFK